MRKTAAGELLRTALRILGYQIAFGFFGFMFIPAVVDSAALIRIPVVGLLLIAGGVLIFMDGSYRGEKDCAMSETFDRLAKKGAYQPSAAEQTKRYSRGKGVWSALLAALPVVLIACYVAFTAKPYAYTLQDLPGWLGAYLHRGEIGGALAYLNAPRPAAALSDYLRVAVRFILFPYVGLFGQMTDAQSLLFDRIAPALALIMPTVTAVGYQFGPARRKKSLKLIEQAKRTPKKRLKKDRTKQPAGNKEKKQLI